MSIIDISRTLNPSVAVWPGDERYRLETVLRLVDGASVNLTRLHLSAHTATHVDAPYHFAQEGKTLEAMPLHIYWGPAQVFTVQKEGGPLQPEDLAACDLTHAPRILIRSASSSLPQTEFPAQFVYPSPELAAHMARAGIILFGSDAPSMDAENSKTLDGHHALHAHNIAILEWLNLQDVQDGLYELVALPLKVEGGDGSPVRAALRPLT